MLHFSIYADTLFVESNYKSVEDDRKPAHKLSVSGSYLTNHHYTNVTTSIIELFTEIRPSNLFFYLYLLRELTLLSASNRVKERLLSQYRDTRNT